MKKIAIGIGAIVFIVLALALLAPVFIDLNDFKPNIARQVEAATGRKLVITGDIDARVFPSPRASVRGIRFANIDGAANANMATLDSVEVDLALGPLLSGDIQVRSITLVKPVIAIEVLADGRSSLDIVSGDGSKADTGANAGQGDDDGPAIRIDRVVIEQGSISFRDAKSDQTVQIDAIDATLSAESLQGPFAGVGELVLRQVPINFAISTGSLAAQGPIGLGDAGAMLTFRGQASEPTQDAHIDGKLKLSGGDLGRLIGRLAQLAGSAPGDLPKMSQPYVLTAGVDATRRDVALNDFALELGDSNARGAINAALGNQIRVDVALSVNRLDADSLLADLESNPSTKTQAPAASDTSEPESVGPASFTLPENLNGSVILEVEALTYRDRVVRRAALDAAIENGTVKLQRLAAQLPGGSDVAIEGTLTTVDRAPQFEGSIRANSDNIRAVLDWLSVDTKSIAVDRLRKFALSSQVRVTADVAQVYDIDLILDSTKITGGTAYAFRTRPSFSIDATLDRFNIDAYLPSRSGEEPQSGTGEAAREPAKSKQSDAVAPLAVLDTFDTNFKLSAGSLIYSGTSIQELKVDLSLLAGELTVRELSTTNAVGVAAALSARGRNFSKNPAISTDFNMTIAKPSRAARALAISEPMIARLGEVTAKGSISGSAASLAVNTTLAVKGLKAVVSGTITGVGLGAADETPAFDLSLNLSSPNLATFVRRLDPTIDLDVKGAVEAIGKVKGGLEALDIDLALNAAGAQMNAAGALMPLAGPEYSLQLAMSHPDVAKFLANVGVDYQPAAVNLGGVSIKTAVQGNHQRVTLSGMDGKIGPARFSCDVGLSFGDARPRIDANIRTSEILLDLFLPRAEAASQSGKKQSGSLSGGGRAAQERWSRDPIDLGFANTFDGTIQISSRGITWGAYDFVEPQLKLAVEDGVIDVNPLLGKLFAGDVQIAARVSTADTPRLGLSLNLTGADLAAAIKQAAGIDTLTGLVDIQGQFTALGRNQFEMISTLGGEGSASARDGSVTGINLRALSDRLQRLNEITDYLSLIQSTMGGGVTQFQSVGGEFSINRGVVTANGIRAQLDAAEGAAKAKIDLPRWDLNLTSRFRLTEHANAPTVGLDLSGPIDAPRRDVRTRELEAYLAQRAGASIIRKALGKNNPLSNILGGSSGSATPSATQQPTTGGQIPPPPPTGQTQQQQPAASPAQQLLQGLGTLLKKN